MLQWFSTKFLPLIGQLVYPHYFYNHSFDFRIGICEPPLVSLTSDQCTILLQWFSIECQPLIGQLVFTHYLHNHRHIASILELGTHLSESHNWLVYCNAPVTFCQMPASDWLIGLLSLYISTPTHHIAYIFELWAQPTESHNWLMYYPTSVITTLMPASELLIDFTLIISTNTHCIASILILWILLSESDSW